MPGRLPGQVARGALGGSRLPWRSAPRSSWDLDPVQSLFDKSRAVSKKGSCNFRSRNDALHLVAAKACPEWSGCVSRTAPREKSTSASPAPRIIVSYMRRLPQQITRNDISRLRSGPSNHWTHVQPETRSPCCFLRACGQRPPKPHHR